MEALQLRWFSTHDDEGNSSAEELQFWDEETKMWWPIPKVQCHESEEDEYNEKPLDSIYQVDSDHTGY